MNDIIQHNWLAFAAVGMVALLILVWLIGRASKPAARRERRPDVLDEGVAPAARNQALIDSPMAMTIVPPAAIPISTVDPMGGQGEAAAAPFSPANAEAAQWEQAERAEATATEADGADDLGTLKGVGPKLVASLRTLGVVRFAQIAGWNEADIDRIDAQLGPFQGRIRRDGWVEQARLLASGDTLAYEEKFGRL